MSGTLYDVLGVPKDADSNTVKAGYRLAARRAHPDKGGSGDKMAAVNKAYEVLSDPERRKVYDETGDEKPVNSIEQEAVGLAGAIFGEAIEQDQISTLAYARQKARDIRDGLARQRAQALSKIRRLEAKSKKVRRKTKDAPNMVQAAIDAQMSRYHAVVKDADRKLEVAKAACLLVNDYDEDNPTPPGLAAATFTLGGFSTFA
jgi:curved DNA-binding protein CbpA